MGSSSLILVEVVPMGKKTKVSSSTRPLPRTQAEPGAGAGTVPRLWYHLDVFDDSIGYLAKQAGTISSAASTATLAVVGGA